LISFESNEVSGQTAAQHNQHGTEPRAIYLMALAAIYNKGVGTASVQPVFGSAVYSFNVTQYKSMDTSANNQSGCYCFALEDSEIPSNLTTKEYKYFASNANSQIHFMNVLSALRNEDKSVTGENYGFFSSEITQTDLMRLVAPAQHDTQPFSSDSYVDLYRDDISVPTSTSTVAELNSYYNLGKFELSHVFITNTTDLTLGGNLTSGNATSDFFRSSAPAQAGNHFDNGNGVFGGQPATNFKLQQTHHHYSTYLPVIMVLN
jgi:hypothetical protein